MRDSLECRLAKPPLNLFKRYEECIKDGAKQRVIRATLIEMINNRPGYQYLQERTQEHRVLNYLRVGMFYRLSFEDLIYIIEKCNIQDPQLLHASVEANRIDILKKLLHYYNEDLNKNYKLAVELVLSAVEYSTSTVHRLISDYNIDIWNPPKHINKTEHYGHIWQETIFRYNADYTQDFCFVHYDTACENATKFIDLFMSRGADINAWFYGHSWMYKEYNNPEYFSHYSPLTYAISIGNFNVAKYLISRGAYVNDPVFPSVFASIKYGLHSRPQGEMISVYNDLGTYDAKTSMIRNIPHTRTSLLLVIQHGNADPEVRNNEKQDIYQYIDDIMYFDIETHEARNKIFQNRKQSENFWKWHGETVAQIKDIVRTAISDALDIVKLNKKIVAKSMDMVMKLMVMSNQIRSNQILSGNILGIVMEFHGGLGDELNPESLRGLEILLEKHQFLLSHKLGNKLGHKKHYEKLGFFEKKGGILCQKEGDLGQKKCDLPAIDVRNEQNMGACTEEVCKNVQKTIKNSTFLNNLDADSISIVEMHLNMQHHNVRSVAFNTMSAMLDDTLIAQVEWYVREGRALNTFATAVANGDVTVISEPSTINEAVRIAEIAVSPDSEANLGREATSQITTVDEAPNGDIIVHSDNALFQAMDLIHGLHFDTALTTTLTSSSHYAL